MAGPPPPTAPTRPSATTRTPTSPNHHRAVADQIQQLRDLGVRLAIDDFGIGYPALRSLHTTPVNELNIDHTFDRSSAAVATRRHR